MKRLYAETLDGLLGREHQLPLDEAMRIGLGLAEALRSLHEAGVVHGGLGPQHVMLASDGTVQLLGLGVVPVPSKDAAGTTSPPADGERADLDAAGLLLFQMVIGHAPPPNAEGRDRVRPDDATDPAARLQALCRRVTSSNRQDRPPTAAALALELRSIQGAADDPIHQRMLQVWERPSQHGSQLRPRPANTELQGGGPPGPLALEGMWSAWRHLVEGTRATGRSLARWRGVILSKAAKRAALSLVAIERWRKGAAALSLVAIERWRKGAALSHSAIERWRKGVALSHSAIERWRLEPWAARRAIRVVAVLLLLALPIATGWLLGGLGAGRYVAGSVPVPRGSAAPPAARSPSSSLPAAASVSVPHLAGLTVPQAWSLLMGNGLALASVVPVVGDPGLVTRSDPREGTLVRAGMKVTLFVGALADRRIGGATST